MSPEDAGSERFYKSLIRQIRRSRRPITIMFTDVEGSTQYWESRGDVQGRLMIDLHNRLIVPLIRRRGGRVVKHVGDSIMASFKSPKQALRAAIGIQQILERRRQTDKGLPSIRIGLHAGKALVENDDVFGDMVNVAARVGEHAGGDEICVSGGAASKVRNKEFNLVKRGTFLPRGKRQSINVFECRWWELPSLIDDVGEDAPLPLVGRQKIDLVVYAVVLVAISGFLCFSYLRFLLADVAALSALNRRMPPLWITGPALTAALVGLLALLSRGRSWATLLYRCLKGGFGFAIGFLVLFVAACWLPWDLGSRWSGELWATRHDFVEVQGSGVTAHRRASERSEVVATLPRRRLLIVRDVRQGSDRWWLDVRLGGDLHGWVGQTVPARVGVPEIVQAEVRRLRVRYRDVYALLIGLLGFLWGFLTFRIRPM